MPLTNRATRPRIQEERTKTVDPRLEAISHLLDGVFRILGTNIRFGIDPIIGLLLPGGGDAVSSAVSAWIIWNSIRLGVPKIITARMVFNVGLDYLVGIVPFLGDLFDFAFKANQKNMELMRKFSTGERNPTAGDYLWAFLLIGALFLLLVGSVIATLLLLAWAGFPLF